MEEYCLVVKMKFKALDDVSARQVVSDRMTILVDKDFLSRHGETETKLQRLIPNKPPQGVLL